MVDHCTACTIMCDLGKFPFKQIEKNSYIIENKSNLRCREYKDIKCSCERTSDEDTVYCGTDCLNRVLHIECSSQCQFGDLCSNKCFQNGCIYDLEVIKTEKKGFGLKTNEFIRKDSFVIEYVGEVIDHREYIFRCKLYHNQARTHFYAMSLKEKYYIDATQCGGIARFINHSCDANMITQKWTVKGYPRIGFFAVRNIEPGEELSFDYQFQRFGDKPQTCYCESAKCRGTIGQQVDANIHDSKEDSFSESESDDNHDGVVEEFVSKPSALKRKNGLLRFVRLMLHVEGIQKREKMLEVIRNCKCETTLKNLMKLNVLKLIWTWMVDLDLKSNHSLVSTILETINLFPITTYRYIGDNKLDAGLKRWITTLEGFCNHQHEPADHFESVENYKQMLELCQSTLIRWDSLPKEFRIPKISLSKSENQTIESSKSFMNEGNNQSGSHKNGKNRFPSIYTSPSVHRQRDTQNSYHSSHHKSFTHASDRGHKKHRSSYGSRSREDSPTPPRLSSSKHQPNDVYGNHSSRNTSKNDRFRDLYYSDKESPKKFKPETSALESVSSSSHGHRKENKNSRVEPCVTPIISPLRSEPSLTNNSQQSQYNFVNAREMAFNYFRTKPNDSVSDLSEDHILLSKSALDSSVSKPKIKKVSVSKFKQSVSSIVIDALGRYHRKDCKRSKIENVDDFKFLARLLTHGLIKKEINHVGSAENLVVNSKVKSRIRSYITFYMSKFGKSYRRT